MAKPEKIDRTQLDRYRPGRTVAIQQTVSVSNRGSLRVSADLMADWPPERQFVVLYAGPGGAAKRTHLYLEPAGPDDRGSLKIQRDDCGSVKLNGKVAIHQFGLDDVVGVRRCPARWLDGLIVAGIEEAEIVTRAPQAASKHSGTRLRVMRCPGCGKSVSYRLDDGHRVTRAHKDPDGLPCAGTAIDED